MAWTFTFGGAFLGDNDIGGGDAAPGGGAGDAAPWFPLEGVTMPRAASVRKGEDAFVARES